MNTSDLISALRSLADELKPFTREVQPGSRLWNGTAYVKAEEQRADPYALSWCSILTTIADMIEIRETPVTVRQAEYVKRTLFGGMGSFNDFSLDTNVFGESGKRANTRLEANRTKLYGLFE